MKVKYQADANLNLAIVSGTLRREPAIDFRTAQEAGLGGVNDLRVLRLAAEEGRILVSHDRRTLPHHFGRFIEHRRSSGVFLIAQNLPVAVAIESLLLIWLTSEASEWDNRICSLPLRW